MIFTDWYKPGFKAGGPVQSVYNLAVLLSKNMNVKVLTRNTDLNNLEPYQGIAPNQWIEIAENHQVMYLDKKNTKIGVIKDLIKENKLNVIYINGLFSIYFSFLPALICSVFGCKHVFISVRGMLHRSALSVKPLKKQVFLAFARGFGLYNDVTMIASNEEEKQEIKRSFSKSKVKIAPNIPLLSATPGNNFVFKGEKGRLRVLFLGRIAPEKNPIALLQAAAVLDFEIELMICGGYNNPGYFSEFQKLLEGLPTNIHANYLGELPVDQVHKLLSSVDVMALPSLGENFGHAIYESLVFGVPVIIGDNTPWKNMESDKAGIEVSPQDVKGIASALNVFEKMDASAYDIWRKGAFQKAASYLANHDFEKIYSELFN